MKAIPIEEYFLRCSSVFRKSIDFAIHSSSFVLLIYILLWFPYDKISILLYLHIYFYTFYMNISFSMTCSVIVILSVAIIYVNMEK